MCGDEPAPDCVPVPRFLVATAIDLLRDVEREYRREGASGPYLDEITETADGLERSLKHQSIPESNCTEKTYGLFAESEQDPGDYFVLCGGPVTVDAPTASKTALRSEIAEAVRERYDFEGEIPEEDTFVAEFSAFPEPSERR